MTKNILILGVLSILFIQCNKDKDPFLITKSEIGSLSKTIKINQLDSIFSKDSIVPLLSKEVFLSQGGQVEIYEKGGVKLMLLSPINDKDPNSKISNIQLFDARYKTEKGLHLNSTFKDLRENYTISSIQNGLSSLVISLVESDVYVTISKEVLPESIRNEFGLKIDASDIPDDAKFKFFMVGWENQEE